MTNISFAIKLHCLNYFTCPRCQTFGTKIAYICLLWIQIVLFVFQLSLEARLQLYGKLCCNKQRYVDAEKDLNRSLR